jgi:predicted permease
MVLSYHMWTGHFGADPSVVGRALREPYTGQFVTVIGVAPAGLDYPVGSDAWVNFFQDARTGTTMVARLAASATQAAAAAELLQLAPDLLGPARLAGTYRAATPTLPQVMFVNVRLALTVLTISVGLLLLTVCLNVGNLLLARANSRTREIALRRALGADRWDIVRQFGVENLLLAIGGGAVGLALGEAFLRVVIVTAPPGLPRIEMVRLAGTPLLYTAVIALGAGIVCGIAPAFVFARRDVFSALRADTRSGREGAHSHRVRRALVVSQIALAVLLVSAAALLTRSLERLQAIDLGYQPEHLSILVLSHVARSPAEANALYDDIAQRLRAVPGVLGVTPIGTRPFEAPEIYAVRIVADGRADDRPEDAPRVSLAYGGSEYFRVLGIPILRGRAFLASEMQEPADVAVVSEQTARLLWPNQDPIGKRVRFRHAADDKRVWTVVGVAGDIRYRRLTEQTATLYLPWRVMGFTAGIAVRTSGPLSSSLRDIRQAVRESKPRVSIWYAEPATRDLDAVLAQPRLTAGLASALGLSSLLIAVLGLYAIMTAAVGDRIHEIGIRMAMGATPWRVRTAVMADALKLTTAGTAVGLGAALIASRLVVKLLYQVNPTDPAMLLQICTVLFGVGLITAYAPAQRATKADPAASLRSE